MPNRYVIPEMTVGSGVDVYNDPIHLTRLVNSGGSPSAGALPRLGLKKFAAALPRTR